MSVTLDAFAVGTGSCSRRRFPRGQGAALYPDCGCPPEDDFMRNVVCRNAECPNYGVHCRGPEGDHCPHCGRGFTLLADDPFRGAR